MLILLIVLLWIFSIGLRIISSGIDTLVKIKEKSSPEKSGDDEQLEKLITSLPNKFLRLIAMALDVSRYILTAFLPLVLVLDIVVAMIIMSVTGGYLLLLDDGTVYSFSTSVSSSSEQDNSNGKSKVLLVGDSRTAQLATLVLGMSSKDTDGPAGITVTVIGKSSSGDYIISKGSEALEWVKQVESDIDAQIDSDTAIVMNMGTNGLGAEQYVNYMNAKHKEWEDKGASVYFCTTNPVLDEEAAKWSTITDSQVVDFNTEVKAGLDSSIGWIDTYSEVRDMVIVEKKTPEGDGVHYEKEVYDKIWEVICNQVKSADDDSSSGSLGSKVYKESLKYVGVLPYVYGGSSLEDGADCSGFVCALYSKFGCDDIWNYRTADSMVNVGTEISDIKDAKAGDILCFNGHVAIYDGNGGMVHERQSGENARHETTIQNGLRSIRRIDD